MDFRSLCGEYFKEVQRFEAAYLAGHLSDQDVTTNQVYGVAKNKRGSGKLWSSEDCQNEIRMIDEYTIRHCRDLEATQATLWMAIHKVHVTELHKSACRVFVRRPRAIKFAEQLGNTYTCPRKKDAR